MIQKKNTVHNVICTQQIFFLQKGDHAGKTTFV